MEVWDRVIKAQRHFHSSTCRKLTNLNLRDQRAKAYAEIMTTFKRLRVADVPMSGSNVEHAIVKDVPYVILMRMDNGKVVEIMAIGPASIEEGGGRELVAVRLTNPKITKTHQ